MSQQLTLRDFKQWLAGVEEMQEDGWVPSIQQWNKIREKLNNIVEQPPGPPAYVPPPVYRGPTLPLQPEIVENPQFTQQTEQLQPRGTPAPRISQPPNVPMGTGSTSERVKTPNIDTSNGGYNSTFE